MRVAELRGVPISGDFGFGRIPKVLMAMNMSVALVTFANRVVRQLSVLQEHFVSLVDQAAKLLRIGVKHRPTREARGGRALRGC